MPDGADFRISGTKPYVLDGAQADLVVVAARTAAGISLFTVDAKDGGVDGDRLFRRWTRPAAWPPSRSTDTPAQLLGVEGQGWDVLSRVLDIAAAGLACEQVGGAARVLESTVDYVKVQGAVRQTRSAPSRPSSTSWPTCSSSWSPLAPLPTTRSSAVESSSPDLPLAASIAKTYCSTAYYHIAAESIQLHGGIGFTWEHPAHLYFKRAKGSETAARLPRPPPRAHRPAAQPVGRSRADDLVDPLDAPGQAQGVPSMVMVLTWVCSSTASAPWVRPNPLLL